MKAIAVFLYKTGHDKYFGIELVEVDESYTSEISMSGDRMIRSLFKDLKLNEIFHAADVNAGFNILKIGLKKKNF